MAGYVHGGHLRGRVRPMRRQYYGLRWAMDVVNTKTGVIVAYDNGYRSIGAAVDDCSRTVEAARIAWSRGFLKKPKG